MHVTASRSTIDADPTYSGHGNELNYSFVAEVLLQLVQKQVSSFLEASRVALLCSGCRLGWKQTVLMLKISCARVVY